VEEMEGTVGITLLNNYTWNQGCYQVALDARNGTVLNSMKLDSCVGAGLPMYTTIENTMEESLALFKDLTHTSVTGTEIIFWKPAEPPGIFQCPTEPVWYFGGGNGYVVGGNSGLVCETAQTTQAECQMDPTQNATAPKCLNSWTSELLDF